MKKKTITSQKKLPNKVFKNELFQTVNNQFETKYVIQIMSKHSYNSTCEKNKSVNTRTLFQEIYWLMLYNKSKDFLIPILKLP